jgi:hypothetical protein
MEELSARVDTHLKPQALQQLQEKHNVQSQQEVKTRKQAEEALIEVIHGVRNCRTPLLMICVRH